jgi:hypothetical protein
MSDLALVMTKMELVDSDLRRMAELVRRYADRRLGGTDA